MPREEYRSGGRGGSVAVKAGISESELRQQEAQEKSAAEQQKAVAKAAKDPELAAYRGTPVIEAAPEDHKAFDSKGWKSFKVLKGAAPVWYGVKSEDGLHDYAPRLEAGESVMAPPGGFTDELVRQGYLERD